MSELDGEASVYHEGKLMHTCGHLYVSIALEALSTTLMSLIFAYLLLLVTNRGRLRNPGRAAMSFLTRHTSDFFKEVFVEVGRWREMKDLPLEKRFALCRKGNQAICVFQILIGVLTIERFLHINNVNGFRYLGYAVTCPPMHTELIVLIAPVVPCYHLQCYFTYAITTAMLLCAYSASLIQDTLFKGDAWVFFETGDVSELALTRKGTAVAVGGSILGYLTFIHIPYLCTLYTLGGGVKGGLPHGFRKLLGIVAVTWLAFPMWWCLSYEGLDIISDTKMNAVGFAILNIISKGSFTLQMLSMSRWHREERRRQKGRTNSNGSRSPRDKRGERSGGGVFGEGLFDPQQSSHSFGAQPSFETKKRESLVLEMLRPYDDVAHTGEAWLGLEFDYRAFLVGQGVTAGSWKDLSTEQRTRLGELYQERYDLVSGDRTGSEGGHACSIPTASLVIAELNEEEVEREDRVSSPPAQKQPRIEDQRHGTPPPEMVLHHDYPPEPAFEPPVGSSEVRGFASVSEHSHGPRVGQVVTTQTGLKGRVLRLSDGDVEVSVQGKRRETLPIEKLSVLRVAVMGARGLRAADPNGTLQLYCSAMVDKVPSSEVQTAARAPGASRGAWEEELSVYGYAAGGALCIRLWGRDPNGAADDALLGEASLPSEAFEQGDHEEEVRLNRECRNTQTFLTVTVVAANLPRAPVELRKAASRRLEARMVEEPSSRAVAPPAAEAAEAPHSLWCSCPQPR